MFVRNQLGTLVVLLAAMGCGGVSVASTKLAELPANPENCAVEIVPVVATQSRTAPESIRLPDAAPTSWQVVGTVGVAAIGVDGPFADGHFDHVRAEACAMGGEAVAVLATGASQAAGGPDLAYAVLRRPSAARQAAAEPSPRAVHVR